MPRPASIVEVLSNWQRPPGVVALVRLVFFLEPIEPHGIADPRRRASLRRVEVLDRRQVSPP